MNIIIYGLIFIIGTLFGSFFTLAVYRIPLGEDILYKHSFCPNCKAKLTFTDLIPVVSYIALGGKCSHCGEKIRIRYLLLEVLSGVVFLLVALLFDVNVMIVNTKMVIYFLFYILYISSLFIIAGIDKENITIQRSLLVFALILSLCYMTYVYILNNSVIYTYIIYLVCMILLLIADAFSLKKYLQKSYTVGILALSLYIMIFSGPTVSYLTIILTLIIIGIRMIIIDIKERKKKKITTIARDDIKMPIGFYLCVSNILLILICNFLNV